MIKSNEETKILVEELGYIFIDEYIKEKSKRIIFKDFNGYKYDVVFHSFINPKINKSAINKSNPFTIENIKIWLNINKPDINLISNTYLNNREKLKFYHSKCGEEFYMRWTHISRGINCPICRGLQVGKYNSLEYLRPDLKREWSNKNKVSPNEITLSSGRKFIWICSKGHEYSASVDSRTNRNTGCKICSDEKRDSNLATELKEYFIKNHNAITEYKIVKNPKTGFFLPFDIYLPKENIFIEVHGIQHYVYTPFFHKSMNDFIYRKKLDKIKKSYAKKHGLYIEVDLRKIKTINEAIKHIQNFI